MKTGAYFVLFSVWDTGIGIPADKVDRLFQSFSQVGQLNITKNTEGLASGWPSAVNWPK